MFTELKLQSATASGRWDEGKASERKSREDKHGGVHCLAEVEVSSQPLEVRKSSRVCFFSYSVTDEPYTRKHKQVLLTV